MTVLLSAIIGFFAAFLWEAGYQVIVAGTFAVLLCYLGLRIKFLRLP